MKVLIGPWFSLRFKLKGYFATKPKDLFLVNLELLLRNNFRVNKIKLKLHFLILLELRVNF